jgi:hypothetical protein
VVDSGFVVIERDKPLRFLSPRAKIRPNSNSTTFHHCTIVAMFTSNTSVKTNNGVHPLQLMVKAARIQSSPQLYGSSSLTWFDNRSQDC